MTRLSPGARKGVRTFDVPSEKWTPIAAFECRGLEPTECNVSRCGPLSAETAGGTEMNVVLEDGDWADYCEKEDIRF